jgi:hypothetical protein
MTDRAIYTMSTGVMLFAAGVVILLWQLGM